MTEQPIEIKSGSDLIQFYIDRANSSVLEGQKRIRELEAEIEQLSDIMKRDYDYLFQLRCDLKTLKAAK